MKRPETVFKAKKRFFAVMLLCFLFGGFSLLSFVLQTYSLFWRTEILGFPFIESGIVREPGPRADFNNLASLDTNRFAQSRAFSNDPLVALSSPTSLFMLFGGIVAIAAGIALWSLIREKEIKTIKHNAASNLLLPDERVVIDMLKRSGYESTQSKIARESGLGKVQTHRTIKRLESKGLLEKHEYGLTNKIILKKELFE